MCDTPLPRMSGTPLLRSPLYSLQKQLVPIMLTMVLFLPYNACERILVKPAKAVLHFITYYRGRHFVVPEFAHATVIRWCVRPCYC